MQFAILKNLKNIFLEKAAGVFVKLPKPFMGREFNADQITVAVLCDPADPSSCHIERMVGGLSNHANIVLIAPKTTKLIENYSKECWKIYAYDNARSPLHIASATITALKHLPFLQYVLVDQAVNSHFLKVLWQNSIASLLFLNKRRVDRTQSLNKLLSYATRVIYDNAETYNHVLTYHLWAKPDQVELYDLADAANSETITKSIAEIGNKACAQLAREEQDSYYLANHAAFDCDYYSGKPRKQKARLEAAKKYVCAYKSGATAARPSAGIHPGLYAESHDLGYDRADPFVHYLQNGMPKGIWCWNVIKHAMKPTNAILPLSVALHIHAYYPDMLDGILSAVMKNRIRPDIYISVKDGEDQKKAENAASHYPFKTIIRQVPNRGRDIGPLLTGFGPELISQYEFIGHLHTKQSHHLKNPERVEKWNRFLMMNLLGDEHNPMADTIISYMASHPKTALVFPDDKYAVGWAQNHDAGVLLAKRLGLNHLPDFTIFPVGTMFWARAKALKPFVALDIKWDDYPLEPLANDGTMLHAIERLLALSCFHQNLDIATTYLDGIKR